VSAADAGPGRGLARAPGQVEGTRHLFDVLAEALSAGEFDLALLAHTTPDGDALGSALAVAHALRELGHRPRVSWGDEPFAVPRPLRALPGTEPGAGFLVPPGELAVTERTVLLVFDCASADRLGLLRPALDVARPSGIAT